MAPNNKNLRQINIQPRIKELIIISFAFSAAIAPPAVIAPPIIFISPVVFIPPAIFIPSVFLLGPRKQKAADTPIKKKKRNFS